MLGKPFRPLTVSQPSASSQPATSSASDEPPLKKRRVTPQVEEQHPENDPPKLASPDAPSSNPPPTQHAVTSSAPKPQSRFSISRKPLHSLVKPLPAPQPKEQAEDREIGFEAYYNVVWRKFTTKKNKTWDGDGVLAVSNGLGILTSEEGKQIGRTKCSGPLLPDTILSISGKEVQVENLMKKEDYLAGRKFLGPMSKPSMLDVEEKLRTSAKFKPLSKAAKEQAKEDAKPERPLRTVVPSSKATQSSFKTPVVDSTVLPQVEVGKPTPRHDPYAPDAIVMKRPTGVPKGKQIVEVVVDPVLSKSLREHQKEGVRFMYECVMGMRPYCGDGAILADEMGLGKTLQVIALLWTLLKQNPIYEEAPVVKKAIVVCPATVIQNWRKEFRKWLGKERIGVFVMEEKSHIRDFTHGKAYNVMIVGYERLRTVAADLQKGPGIDIVVADEGHRLKTERNKSGEAIKALSTSKRIILSGTPLQNNLSEYFFTVDFVNPGLLGKYNTFKKAFETPIVKSRQPEATQKEKDLGEARGEELAKLTGMFILRRTAEILAKYLPPKAEYVLFCRPTSTQASVYRAVLSTPEFGAVLNSPETSLQLITILKKLCNSPSLLRSAGAATTEDSSKESAKAPSALITAILSHIPPSLLKSSPGASGKIQVLDSLLHRIRTATSEKVVIVSHYTATLDILGNLLRSLDYPFLRLDGSTAQKQRQELVDRFNKAPTSQCFAFLLSAKSGGVGLNLVGASRLVLFDNDWNPSTDLQAMARIHRDGQTMPCKIYRLLTKGALDEKIFQRQASKLSLADSVVDGKVSASSFSREELRDLFRLDEFEGCRTHELLNCSCGGDGSDVSGLKKGGDVADAVEAKLACGDASGGVEASPGMEEEDDEDLPSLNQLIKGSQVAALYKRAAIEEAKEKALREENAKGKMLALMQYRHFDVGRLVDGLVAGGRTNVPADGEDDYQDIDELPRKDSGATGSDDMELAMDDGVLVDVLKDRERRIAFVFAKMSS